MGSEVGGELLTITCYFKTTKCEECFTRLSMTRYDKTLLSFPVKIFSLKISNPTNIEKCYEKKYTLFLYIVSLY